MPMKCLWRRTNHCFPVIIKLRDHTWIRTGTKLCPCRENASIWNIRTSGIRIDNGQSNLWQSISLVRRKIACTMLFRLSSGIPKFCLVLFFLTQDFVQTYFVHLICYHVQLWHGRSWFFSPLSKAELSIWRNHSVAYTPTDVCLLCSKVDLMEEDHILLALVPMQNPVREAEFLWPCKFPKWHISSWGSQFQYVSVLVVLTFLEHTGPGWFGPCLKHLLGSCQTYILLFRME